MLKLLIIGCGYVIIGTIVGNITYEWLVAGLDKNSPAVIYAYIGSFVIGLFWSFAVPMLIVLCPPILIGMFISEKIITLFKGKGE